MKTIFLVEDDPAIRESVSKFLKISGFHVLTYSNGKRAYERIRKFNPSLIILDISMPEMDGKSFLSSIRSENINTPVLVLTAKSDINTKAQLFDLGGDDFLSKPFDLNELKLRIKALLKRVTPTESNSNFDSYLDLEVDQSGRIVRYKDNILNLTKTEYLLITLLVKNKNIISKNEDIFLTVWGRPFKKGSKNLNVVILNLRNKLINVSYPYKLVSVRGVGYKIGE